MSGLEYAWEQFSTAADILATGAGDLRERLVDAYSSRALRVDDIAGIPPTTAERIADLRERLTRLPAAADEGTVRATVYLLSDDEVAVAAHEILWIALDLAEAVGHGLGSRGLPLD